MKKIFFACIAIISMLLLTAQPLYVHAADVTPVHEYTEIEDIGTEDIPANIQSRMSGLQYMLNSNAYEENAYFFYTVYKKTNGSSERYYEIFYSFSDATVSFENGYLDINFAVNPTGKSTNEKIYWYNKGSSSNGYDDYKTGSTYTHVELRWGDTISVNFYDRNGNNYSPRMGTSGDVPNGFCTFVSNIPEILNSAGSIDVVFTPSLAGVVTRSTTNDNGVNGLSNYFSMDITNNTSYGCQYRMMIKDTNGQAVTPYNQGDSDTNYQPNWENGFSVNDDGSFVFINDEWIYVSPTIGGGVCKALKPSEWHYIDSHDSIHQDFSWSQFDFKKDHTYICMVYAITNELGCATALDSSRTGLYNNYPDYCLDFTTQALVYQTVFSISNPATFNPNDNSFGNKIRNANWSGDKGEFSAYENPSNGQLISGNGNVDELRDLPNSVVSGGSHGGGGYSTYHDSTLNNIYGFGSYTSNRSFAQLNSYFGGYFGFLSAIIGFYPSPYQTLIMIGFAGLVVIGILKAAIK